MDNAQITESLIRWGYMEPGVRAAGSRSPLLRAAVEKYQQVHSGLLSRFTTRHHNRDAWPDGDIGPATRDLFDLPRCDCPDFIDGAPASARAEARWPDACKDSIIAAYRFDGLNLSSDEVAKRWVAAQISWNKRINVDLTLDNTRFNEAQIWATDGPLSGNTLAWSMLANNSCSSRLEQRYNTKVNWDGQYFQAVKAHEDGHALGLPHLTNDPESLMYPYARRHIYLPQAGDVALAVKLGYEERGEEPENPKLGKLVAYLVDSGRQIPIHAAEDAPTGGGWLGLD